MSQEHEQQGVDENVSHVGKLVAQVAIGPSLHCATVVKAYSRNLVGEGLATQLDTLSASLEIQEMADRVIDGDLSELERMLAAQAVTLQSVFSDLVLRASGQQSIQVHSSLMTLALKAQSNCRATISALAELKFPRQTLFAKQANIAHGAQQVNNAAVPLNQPASIEPLRSTVQDTPLPVLTEAPRTHARAEKPKRAKQTIGRA